MLDRNKLQFYQENLQLITITGLISGVIVALMNTIILILFLRLFNFFLEYRKTNKAKRMINGGSELTCLNKLIIGWVYFLCALSVWNIGSLMVDASAKFYYGIDYGLSPVVVYYLAPVYKILIPLKDLLVALSFASLYLY